MSDGVGTGGRTRGRAAIAATLGPAGDDGNELDGADEGAGCNQPDPCPECHTSRRS